jgi:DNA repair protein RadA/Sms
MAKAKTAYVCSDCGSEYAKWQGQCDDCGAWNTMSEVRLAPTKKSGVSSIARISGFAGTTSKVQSLQDIDTAEMPRIATGSQELDRVLGGGLVPGSAILIGGHPGAGKSTLLLQILCLLSEQIEALYVTGEESLQQVALRAKRLDLTTNRLKLLSETSVENICATAQQHHPKILVVDSIQVMQLEDLQSAPGGVSQVRECAAVLTRYAKQTGTVLLLVGHVTKDGTLAGPKVLEHMIDCSIMLEGDNDSRFRTLRGIKNRFGAVNELGVFAMTDKGLREVTNPSAIFLSRAEQIAPGSVVMVVWEGTRPLLVEIQALVDDTSFGNPRRLSVGTDYNRLAMLLAVLHRHGGLSVGDQDVFVNVVGGVKVVETSADLALILAIVSSFRDRALGHDLVVFGEVGLSGEIRPVPSGQERLREAAKHGFKRAIVPKTNVPREGIKGMEIHGVTNLRQALEIIA